MTSIVQLLACHDHLQLFLIVTHLFQDKRATYMRAMEHAQYSPRRLENGTLALATHSR